MADDANLGLSFFKDGATYPEANTSEPASPAALPAGEQVPLPNYTTDSAEQHEVDKDVAFRSQLQNEFGPSQFALWGHYDTSVAMVSRFMKSSGFTPDYEYRLPNENTTEGKKLYAGIPDEYKDHLLSAVNAEHADWISNQIRSKLAAEDAFSAHSGAGRLGLGLVDPLNVALVATPAGPEAQIASRLGRFLVGGARAGIEGSAVSALLSTNDQVTTGHDIARSAFDTFMLGGVLHALPSPAGVRARVADDALRAQRELRLNELTDRVNDGTVPPEAVRPEILKEVQARQAADKLEADRAHADAQVGHIENEVDQHLADHETSLKETVEGPEGQAVAMRDDFSETAQRLTEARQTLDEVSNVLTGDREAQVRAEAERLAEADHANAYARGRAKDAGSEPAVFPKWVEQARENVERTRANAAKTAELARGVIKGAEADVARVNRVRTAESALEQHVSGLKAAKSLEDRVALVPHERVRTRLARNLKAARDEQLRLAEPPEVEPTVTPEVRQPGSSSFNEGGSLSAAEATTGVSHVVDPQAGIKPVPRSDTVFKAVNWGPFKSFSSVLRGSSNAIVRSRLGRMFGEAIGAEGHSAATQGASDHMAYLNHSYGGEAARITYAHKAAWMREEGFNGLRRFDPRVRAQWADSVGRAIRGLENTSEHVKAAAQKYSALYNKMLQDAKSAGVKGFEFADNNKNYLPRSFDFDNLSEINRQLGDGGLANFLADSMEKAMKANGPIQGFDRPSLVAIAAGYIARSKKLMMGIDNLMMHGIPLDDFDYIRDLIREGAASGTPVEEFMNAIQAGVKGDANGSTRYAKARIQFDETHSIDVPNGAGGTRRVTVADLWSNDVDHLTERYIRTMSGHIGLARVGIKSAEDFEHSLAEAKESLFRHGAVKSETDLVDEYARGGYNLLTGRPLDNEKYGTLMKSVSVARDYAYTRSMNQSGFTVFNNVIRPWTNGYAKYTSKYLPALGELFSRDAEGNLNNSLAREIERFTGIGTDHVNATIVGHYEDGTAVGKALNAASVGLKTAGRVTSHISLMTPALVTAQRMMALGIVDRLVRHAHGETSVPMKRLAVMGLDDAMMTRIKQQLVENAPETQLTGQKIRSVNWAAWTDLEARDAMLAAVHREARILIHGDDIASTGLWMNKWWGRLFIQMRRFPMMAMSKQLGRGLHMRDADTVMDFLATGTVGMLSYYAQTHLRALGMADTEKQKYLDEHLAMGRLMAAWVQRNPYSGMFPQLIDTAADRTFGSPVFDSRGSGLSGDLLSGMPAADAVSSAANITAAVRDGVSSNRRMTQREWKSMTSMLPFGNSLPMVWMTNAMSENFSKNQLPGSHKKEGSLLDQALNDE